MWIHALAQSYGVNIFENGKIAYANANHGIFDHLIKALFVRVFPALEPQYILRSFVLLFPVISLLATFAQTRKVLPSFAAVVSSICLSSAMLIIVHDIGHWNASIGRSDPTAFTLLVLAYLCYSTCEAGRLARTARHASYLAIALVWSTNWRIFPVALAIPIVMEQRRDTLRVGELIRIYLLIAGYTLATCTFFIAVWFHADISLYYRYFFGFFSAKSPWPPCSAPFSTMIQYVRTPAFALIIVFSVGPMLVELWKSFATKFSNLPRVLAALAVLGSLVVSIAAFKMNFMAAGYWYLCPQVIILLIYYNTRYKPNPGVAAMVLVGSLAVLSRSNNVPLARWQYDRLGESRSDARKYTDTLVLLDRTFGIYSEEAHLFKRSGPLPPIDMGDVVEAFAKVDYYGVRFTSVFNEQKSKIVSHAPMLVFVGGCASSAVKQLAEDGEYCLLLKSPTIQIGGGLYVRTDHIQDVQRFLATHSTNTF